MIWDEAGYGGVVAIALLLGVFGIVFGGILLEPFFSDQSPRRPRMSALGAFLVALGIMCLIFIISTQIMLMVGTLQLN